MHTGALRILLIAWMLVMLAVGWSRDSASQETGLSLRDQLETMASQQGFKIYGIEALQDRDGSSESGGNANERLESLLKGYNYLLLHDGTGQISELRILGPHPSAEELERRVSVKTTRRGSHHLVETLLVGPRGARRKLPLLIDTGASSVVLPSSMIEELGFESAELYEGVSQTAAGPVPVMLGQLHTVQVGHARKRNVTVGFIEDAMLGEQHLLGMSFLGHFRLTIDDDDNRVLLSPH